MHYRSLGRTGLRVSPLCLGAMMFGAWGNPDHDDSVAIIHAALDAGINFIDTADVYSAGESEEIVGKAIAGRRDEVVLATKFFAPMGDGPNQSGGSPLLDHARVRGRACAGSAPTTSTSTRCTDPTRRSTSTRRSARCPTSSTRARSATSAAPPIPASAIVEAQWVAERRGRERFVCEQPPYSILVRGIEADVLPTCQRYGMGVIPWSPLAGGWLSGKWRLGADDLTSRRAAADPGSLRPDQAREPAEARRGRRARRRWPTRPGISLVHLALAWVINNPAVTAAIIGPRTMDQLTSQLGALDVSLEHRRARPHRRDRAAGHQLQLGRRRATPRRRSPAPVAGAAGRAEPGAVSRSVGRAGCG